MVITKVEPYTKTRYKVYADGQPIFILYRGEAARYGITEGRTLSEEDFEKVKKEVLLKRAKLRVMHLLEDMDRTESELRERLHRGLYPDDVAEEALQYVRKFGYIDDERYAENYVRSRKGKKSRKEISYALVQKGITAEQISDAFEKCGEDDAEEDAVRRLLKKKGFVPEHTDDEKMRKLYAYLARKGFRYDTIRQVIQNYNEDA